MTLQRRTSTFPYETGPPMNPGLNKRRTTTSGVRIRRSGSLTAAERSTPPGSLPLPRRGAVGRDNAPGHGGMAGGVTTIPKITREWLRRTADFFPARGESLEPAGASAASARCRWTAWDALEAVEPRLVDVWGGTTDRQRLKPRMGQRVAIRSVSMTE